MTSLQIANPPEDTVGCVGRTSKDLLKRNYITITTNVRRSLFDKKECKQAIA